MLKCDFNKLQSNFIESYFGMGVLLLGERRELSLLPNFQGLDRISIFRGGCWERGDDLFSGWGLSFLHKKLNQTNI